VGAGAKAVPGEGKEEGGGVALRRGRGPSGDHEEAQAQEERHVAPHDWPAGTHAGVPLLGAQGSTRVPRGS